jgi:hypothetical protein
LQDRISVAPALLVVYLFLGGVIPAREVIVNAGKDQALILTLRTISHARDTINFETNSNLSSHVLNGSRSSRTCCLCCSCYER